MRPRLIMPKKPFRGRVVATVSNHAHAAGDVVSQTVADVYSSENDRVSSRIAAREWAAVPVVIEGVGNRYCVIDGSGADLEGRKTNARSIPRTNQRIANQDRIITASNEQNVSCTESINRSEGRRHIIGCNID